MDKKERNQELIKLMFTLSMMEITVTMFALYMIIKNLACSAIFN